MDEVKRVILDETSESMRRLCATLKNPGALDSQGRVVDDLHSAIRTVRNSCTLLGLEESVRLAEAGEDLIRRIRRGQAERSDAVRRELLQIALGVVSAIDLASADCGDGNAEADCPGPATGLEPGAGSDPAGEDDGRPRALVIDDSKAMRRVICRILTGLGFAVVEAESGETALAALDGGSAAPSLVVVDWTLPGMDGIGVVRELKRRRESGTFPIVMVTSENSAAQVEQAYAAGVDQYVTKPFSREGIIDAVQAVGFSAPPV